MVLFIAVFPGNVQMAIDWSDRAFLPRAASLLRLPLQIPLVLWARRVALGPRQVPSEAQRSLNATRRAP